MLLRALDFKSSAVTSFAIPPMLLYICMTSIQMINLRAKGALRAETRQSLMAAANKEPNATKRLVILKKAAEFKSKNKNAKSTLVIDKLTRVANQERQAYLKKRDKEIYEITQNIKENSTKILL